MSTDENTYPKITEIIKITETAEGNGVYELDVKIQFSADSEPEQTKYVSRPSDRYGINPQIRKWIVDNPNFPIDSYVTPTPPTAEEIRASMPKLTRRQFWLAATSINITKESVLASVQADANLTETDKLYITIEVQEATYYNRTNPYVVLLSNAMGVTPEEMDSLWNWAAGL